MIKTLLERNNKDIERLSKILKQIDKLRNSTVSDRIYSVLIEQILYLSEQNKQFQEYISENIGKEKSK